MYDDDYRFTLLINIWMNGKPTKVKYMKEKKLVLWKLQRKIQAVKPCYISSIQTQRGTRNL